MGEHIPEKYILKIRRKAGTFLRKQELVSPSDKILVGLSGGKDSLILLETLAETRRHWPVKFEMYALHVVADNIPYLVDYNFLKSFCQEQGVNLLIREIHPEIEKSDKKICFSCSWNRRKMMFSTARELGCNKLALGHHIDDAIETLLMNMIFHGTMSSLPYKLKMFDGEIELIRPLMVFTKDELNAYAAFRDFPAEKKKCPYDSDTNRTQVRKLTEQMEELHIHARKNIFKSMSKPFPEYLPGFSDNNESEK